MWIVLLIFFVRKLAIVKKNIVYKKTGEWYIERQGVTASSTTSDNEWQRVTTSGKTSENKWQRVVQRMATSGTTSDNEWQRMIASDSKNNKWQRATASGTTNENGTVHFKEWMIAILSVIKTDTLLQGMDGCNYSG